MTKIDLYDLLTDVDENETLKFWVLDGDEDGEDLSGDIDVFSVEKTVDGDIYLNLRKS